ncbi:RagB/SusD family nutrient uptake outer membrane protein [Bacteroides fragilis]|nr:RagB/SusD family nutrient uptake outer membrane protein [Bacteroides fragilis]
MSKEEGLKLIQNERRIELAGEGFRGDDMTFVIAMITGKSIRTMYLS